MNTLLKHQRMNNNDKGDKHGGTAKEFRAFMGSPSMSRDSGQFITPEGNIIEVPANNLLIETITSRAINEGLMINAGTNMNILPGQNPKDFVEMYEKDYLQVGKQHGYKYGSRNTGDVHGDPKQWDNFYLCFEAGISIDDAQRTREIVIEELRSTNVIDEFVDGVRKPQIGIDGKRALYATDLHLNTDNPHCHIFVNRFAFDAEKKEVSKGIDLSNGSTKGTMLKQINARLAAENLPTLVFDSNMSATITQKPVVKQATVEAVNDMIVQAGGEVPIKSNVISPEISDIERGEQIMMDKLQKSQAIIEAQQREITEATAQLRIMQQAKKVLAEQAVMESRVLQAESRATKVEEANAVLVEENNQVKQEIGDFKEKLAAALDAEEISPEATLPEVVEVLVSKLEDTESALETEEGTHQATKATLAETTAKNTQLSSDLDSEKEASAAKDVVISEKDAAIEKMQADLEKLQADMAEMQKTLAAKTEAVVKAEKFESALKNLVVDATGDNSYKSMAAEEVAQKFAYRYTESITETKRVMNERDVIKGRVESLEQQLEGLNKDLKTERDSKQALRVDIAALNQDKAELREELAKVEKQNTRFRTAITDMETELTDLRSTSATAARESGRTEVAKAEEANAAKKQAEKGQELGNDDDLTQK